MMLKMFYYLTIDDTVYVNLFNNTVQRIKDDTTKEEEANDMPDHSDRYCVLKVTSSR